MMIDLGAVNAPSGKIFIVDPGYINPWSHDGAPRVPDGVLSSVETTEVANAAVELEVVGADAEAVGRALDRQWNRRSPFDIPRAGVDANRLASAHLVMPTNPAANV